MASGTATQPNGQSLPDSIPKASPGHHQYACTRCRARRVKCDKIIPACAHCIGIGVPCVYSARRPRQAQKSHREAAPQRPLVSSELQFCTDEPQNNISLDPRTGGIRSTAADILGDDGDDDAVIPGELTCSIYQERVDPNSRGRLLVASQKSRYINSDKADQIADLEAILVAEKIPSEETTSSSATGPSTTFENGLLFGGGHPKRHLKAYHPPPAIMQSLWGYYTRNVDVLIKILYKPSVQVLIESAAKDLKGLGASAEALLFAIWFSTVKTMSNEECLKIHKEERRVVLVKYRYALEQALVQCGWMMTQDIVVLQALMLLMVCAPLKQARSTWTMSGIAMGIAQSIGLHSDSSVFSLDVVATETRRRVWWSLCQLDNRVSEDAGLESHMPLVVDTKLPFHINDADLRMDGLVSRAEFTEMTISLLKIEFAQFSLKVKRSKLGISAMSIDELERVAQDLILRFEETYLSYLDQSSRLHRLCYLGGRLIIAKLQKMSYDVSRSNASARDAGNLDEPLLYYNADVVKIASQLPDDLRQFGWFFRCKYTQWHAMAYLLKQLNTHIHAQSPAVDRAWQVLDSIFEEAYTEDQDPMMEESRRSSLWAPLQRLYKRVSAMRMQALQAVSADGTEVYSTTPVDSMVPTPPNGTLLGDPVLGFGKDFGDSMDWDQLDAWVHDFQQDVSYEQGYYDPNGALSWF
ncbi:hypothetical protein EJ04DRAFT_555118 [Polyplosphaeria fusca]|uniref:Zn(2)-C6 fungal-type domain-containing protein n=1 Tax=Polyplosphaeria fusca TaxID=682080 RepID=A0A9P4QTU3_9PLEO|nr:hypothetical protein EJ04DRAFT_555118 [Polyplosphaeria fusca]